MQLTLEKGRYHLAAAQEWFGFNKKLLGRQLYMELKNIFVLKHLNPKLNENLANYYVRLNAHLIPNGVEIWEYDEENKTALRIY